MNWAIKGLTGALLNQVFQIREGLTLGRLGDVVTADPKASSIHARILRRNSGEWCIEDNKSKNGVRIHGERQESFILSLGMTFSIGDLEFEVVEMVDESLEETQPGAPLIVPPPVPPTPEVPPDLTSAVPQAATPPIEVPAMPVPEVIPEVASPVVMPKPKTRIWNEILVEFLEKNHPLMKVRPREVRPLQPAVVLDFVRGLQINSHWVLGYGPRQVGAASMDLPILEPGAPALCFELIPDDVGVWFETTQKDLVLLNGRPIDRQLLRVGDTIGIHETLIEVGFIE